jgi:hypothetical protein
LNINVAALASHGTSRLGGTLLLNIYIELAHIITTAMIKSIFNAAKVKVFTCFAVLLAPSYN